MEINYKNLRRRIIKANIPFPAEIYCIDVLSYHSKGNLEKCLHFFELLEKNYPECLKLIPNKIKESICK